MLYSVARLAGFEPATGGLEVHCSIQAELQALDLISAPFDYITRLASYVRHTMRRTEPGSPGSVSPKEVSGKNVCNKVRPQRSCDTADSMDGLIECLARVRLHA